MINEVAELFEVTPVAATADRRITKRLLDVWARTARGKFPSWSEMRCVDLGEDWNWVFVTDIEQSIGFPYFVYLGSSLAKLSDVYLSGASDWTFSLLDKATIGIDGAIADEAPFISEDEITLCDQRTIMFRSLTAPLAEDGEQITHVFGVVSGKVICDQRASIAV
jgi:hypothetical protein